MPSLKNVFRKAAPNEDQIKQAKIMSASLFGRLEGMTEAFAANLFAEEKTFSRIFAFHDLWRAGLPKDPSKEFLDWAEKHFPDFAVQQSQSFVCDLMWNTVKSLRKTPGALVDAFRWSAICKYFPQWIENGAPELLADVFKERQRSQSWNLQ